MATITVQTIEATIDETVISSTVSSVGVPGTNTYAYIAYASDALGTDFSLTPTGSLKYRAEIQEHTAIASPDADDFSAATWVKYIGDDGMVGTSAYLYIAYASDSSGTGFSLTPADDLTYVAALSTSTAITTPVVTDFVGLWRLTGVSVDPISITFTSSGDTDVLNPYSLVWTLTVLRIVHGYGLAYLPTYTIMDADGVEFTPPIVTRIDSNTIDIDFGITITGTWSIMLSTGGIGGTGGVGADGTITEASLASVINSATSKETPIDADELPLWDSAIVGMKKLTWANLKATLETYFDTLYGAGTGDVTLSGNNAFTGNNTHSGAETFTGSVVMAISSPTVKIETGRAITSADFGKTLVVDSATVQTMTFPSMAAADNDKGFDIVQGGTANVQCDRADTDTITDGTKTSIQTNEQFKRYRFTYYHDKTMWLLDNGGDWITTP